MTNITLFDAAQAVRESVYQIDPETASGKRQKIRIDMAGRVYGELSVMSFSHLDKNKNAHWLVRCSCGKVKTANGYDIRSGKIISCGHIKAGTGAANQFKHGHALRGSKTRTYAIWRNMLDRCNNSDSPSYANYGARGIRVCQEWQASYATFLRDMGEIAVGMSIERLNVNGNYEPLNCAVLPLSEQVHNRRNTVKVLVEGRLIPLSIACRTLGVSYSAAIQRARRGLSSDEILFKGNLCTK